MASSDWASPALTGWPDLTVALAKLASPGPVSGWVDRAIGNFPYVFISENSDCFAARVSDVRMLSNCAQVDNLPKGAKLSPCLTKNMKLIFYVPPYCPSFKFRILVPEAIGYSLPWIPFLSSSVG